MLTIVGAGSVGLVMGARLARSGKPVLFVTRRPGAADALLRSGVRIENPATQEWFRADVAATASVSAAAGQIGDGPVLFCVRSSQLEDAAEELAHYAPGVTVVSWQNDVGNEEVLKHRFERVIGGVVRLTSTRMGDNVAVTAGRGRLILGDHPVGLGPDSESLSEELRSAGYDVGLSECIAEDKWLKLCINTMSAPNALIRREDHNTLAFVEIKSRLLEEAKSAIETAGIIARSCDGRDRSLAEEIVFQRESHTHGTSDRPLPIYNQVWSALQRGGPLEADCYHRRILGLSSRFGLAAPQNERILEALERALRLGLGPESMGAAELLSKGS